jgi:hypothetical protein
MLRRQNDRQCAADGGGAVRSALRGSARLTIGPTRPGHGRSSRWPTKGVGHHGHLGRLGHLDGASPELSPPSPPASPTRHFELLAAQPLALRVAKNRTTRHLTRHDTTRHEATRHSTIARRNATLTARPSSASAAHQPRASTRSPTYSFASSMFSRPPCAKQGSKKEAESSATSSR